MVIPDENFIHMNTQNFHIARNLQLLIIILKF